jgi:rod shape determining protein RodA
VNGIGAVPLLLNRIVAGVALRLDLPLTIAVLLLAGIGLMTLHSASGGNEAMVMSQGIRLGVGFGAALVLSQLSPPQLRRWSPWLFAGGLLLLALVPIFGTGGSGRRWLYVGLFYVQPSELMKLAVPMAVAAWLHGRGLPPGWRELLVAGLLIAVPTALIVKQPDLGTSLLVASSGAFVLLLSGMHWSRIGMLLGAAVAAMPLGWQFLREYQRNRLRTFLDPEADPLGTGWNIIQSKIAVGSGGMFGKGWGNGTQAQLDFLPEHTTDFIFSVYAEEFGLVGVLGILLLYLFIVGRCLWIAACARDNWSRLVAGALGLTFFIYVLVNGGMVSGLLPVVGAPMPLLSFGGTSAVSLLAAFGIITSIHAHRRFMA